MKEVSELDQIWTAIFFRFSITKSKKSVCKKLFSKDGSPLRQERVMYQIRQLDCGLQKVKK